MDRPPWGLKGDSIVGLDFIVRGPSASSLALPPATRSPAALAYDRFPVPPLRPRDLSVVFHTPTLAVVFPRTGARTQLATPTPPRSDAVSETVWGRKHEMSHSIELPN